MQPFENINVNETWKSFDVLYGGTEAAINRCLKLFLESWQNTCEVVHLQPITLLKMNTFTAILQKNTCEEFL